MASKGNTKYKLNYFDGRGRAELIRLVFAYTETTYEDIRIPFEQWPTIKPKTPYGTMPYMEIDGKSYGQSMPLARYVAATLGKRDLLGKTPLDSLVIEGICDDVVDLRSKLVEFAFESDAEKKAEQEKKFNEDQLPPFLKRLEDSLKANKTGFLHGAQCSLADIAVYDVLFGLTVGPGKDKVLAKSPAVGDLMKKVAASTGIKSYVSKRKDTDF